jgi:putative DNA-invertase from lambdoid prophage Rac
MTVYGYTRSATGNPEQLAEQRRQIEAFWTESQVPVAEFFADEATGFNPPEEREGFARLLERLETGDIVIVADPVRIARSSKDLVAAMEAFRRKGVTLLIAALLDDQG